MESSEAKSDDAANRPTLVSWLFVVKNETNPALALTIAHQPECRGQQPRELVGEGGIGRVWWPRVVEG